MARELDPDGIRVAYVVVDGAVDTKCTRESMGEERYAKILEDGIMRPDDMAEFYWQLHCQRRAAWILEIDIRTYVGSWYWQR